MCEKCQRSCETCQILIEKYDEDELCECDNCGHLFKNEDVVWINNKDGVTETCLCQVCKGNI